jgi:hypothetical protein
MSDKEIKKKFESLDTLAGGVVYGKEEAWEKLQGRLDAKPAKRISLRYRLAAAAVLLLGVIVFMTYDRPAQRLAVKQPDVTMDQPVLQEPAGKNEQQIAMQSPHIKTVPKPIVSKHQALHETKTIANKALSSSTPQPVLTTTTNEQSIPQPDKKEATATVPAVAVKTPMKVIHINDLERNTHTQAIPNTGNNVAALDMKKMPVVHIRDVEKEAIEINKLLKEKRVTIHSFIRLDKNSDPLNEEYYPIQNRLKDIFTSSND